MELQWVTRCQSTVRRCDLSSCRLCRLVQGRRRAGNVFEVSSLRVGISPIPLLLNFHIDFLVPATTGYIVNCCTACVLPRKQTYPRCLHQGRQRLPAPSMQPDRMHHCLESTEPQPLFSTQHHQRPCPQSESRRRHRSNAEHLPQRSLERLDLSE